MTLQKLIWANLLYFRLDRGRQGFGTNKCLVISDEYDVREPPGHFMVTKGSRVQQFKLSAALPDPAQA
jgi:hypothetical protein